MAMWQPTRYAKINLKTLIEIAHAARQILFISMSIVKTVIMVNFKTLKPFHSSWVFFCTFVSCENRVLPSQMNGRTGTTLKNSSG